MKDTLTILLGAGGAGILVVAVRAAIKSYRAKKSIGNIIADTAEAVVDTIDKKD